uniref:Charged multivesicular body protein 7 n=1 Tax=Tetraodon nigroviridis TaxID=99883 RepID=H3DND8_TETNG
MSVSSLTPEWSDDERMEFLFSAFKENRDVNPTDWDSKMDFWTALVPRSCRQRGSVYVSVQELNAAFRRKGKSPLGLATVLQAMARCGKIQKESEFAASVDCGWLSWGVGLLLVRPLRWTLSTLLGGGRLPPEEPYLVVDLVKEKAAEVLGAYRRSRLAGSPVLALAELHGLCAGVCADESTLCVALLQLQRDKQATVCLQDGEKVVKFCQRGQERVSPVSDVDVGIYQLQRSEKLLLERAQRLEAEAQRGREEAKELLREGKKAQALRCLRGCKRVEKRAENLQAKLESISGILDRIAQSQSDKMVVQAYQAGVAALRLSLKDVTVEGAENLVDQIQELCDTQEGVTQTLSGGVAGAEGDLDELEEELKLLLDGGKPGPVSSGPEGPPGVLQPSELLESPPAAPGGAADVCEQEEAFPDVSVLLFSDSQKKKPPSRQLETAQ